MSDINWRELRKAADTVAHHAETNRWDTLPSLREIFPDDALRDGTWKYTDADVADDHELMAVAVRYCRDIVRIGALGAQSSFMNSVVTRLRVERQLTDGQARGVLNVLGGGIKWNRGRFWKSRSRRRDRFAGDENCLVCGGPLTTTEAVSRAIGDTCYRRVMGL